MPTFDVTQPEATNWRSVTLVHDVECPQPYFLTGSGPLDIVIRPSWDDVYMGLASMLAMRSTCRRSTVGAVVVNHDNTRVLAVGYNGNARGMVNDCDSVIPGSCGCVHAEANAIIKLSPSREPMTLYTTLSPCVMCAKFIINAGIGRVVYDKAYRDASGLQVLSWAHVYVEQVPRIA